MNNDYRNMYEAVQRKKFINIDSGLREYMVSVYSYMALGLLITGIVSFLVASSPSVMQAIFGSPLKFLVMFAPVAVVFFLSAKIGSLSFSAAKNTFIIYSVLMGVSLSSIFYVFTGESITRLFFITSSIFGAMSLYGYTTKKDLTNFGSFLMMGVLGIVIASIVNMFLKSSAMQMMISVLGVLLFTGLTAYDTQAIKERYVSNEDYETSGKRAIFGALQLYLDFINLFISLLQLFGDRK